MVPSTMIFGRKMRSVLLTTLQLFASILYKDVQELYVPNSYSDRNIQCFYYSVFFLQILPRQIRVTLREKSFRALDINNKAKLAITCRRMRAHLRVQQPPPRSSAIIRYAICVAGSHRDPTCDRLINILVMIVSITSWYVLYTL